MDKAALRREVLARRSALTDRGPRSLAIEARLRSLPEFGRAGTIASYVGVGEEVSTVAAIEDALARDVTVAVPWRAGNDLHLARILSMAELVPVSFGLLEPPPGLAASPARMLPPEDAGLLLIPGVAFDRDGGRLGHGKGFYDRLLQRAGPGPLRIALAFECQVVENVPMVAGDERMDLVVTEDAIYRVSARTALGGR
ncbi:MAG TPA: 5-formyltetrahydrofolate cyclo-ligase [Gemmatimonadales bacterium]|nr:5-formyltetrahydrofolate cyclo-ligase [Gemmatimonadales bacterium]